jgi:hypothetical protein
VNEERNSAIAHVVILPSSFDQLLRYYISETEQEAGRCALRQHRSPDEGSAVEIGRVITPRPPTLAATAHLYARKREAMIAEVELVAAQPDDRQHLVSGRILAIAAH